MTKEFIILEYERVRWLIGHKPSSTEFFKFSDVTHRNLAEAYGRNSFSKLTKDCGEIPNKFSHEKSKVENIFEQYGKLARKLWVLPIASEWDNVKLKPSTGWILTVHWIKWRDMPNEFFKYAKENNLSDWDDILGMIPIKGTSELDKWINESWECYVYLMLDTKTNFHKIGISNKAEYREKTLQSEKPSIKLVAKKKYINRRIAANFEKALHDSYSHKRKRWEWFLLDEWDLFELKATLDD